MFLYTGTRSKFFIAEPVEDQKPKGASVGFEVHVEACFHLNAKFSNSVTGSSGFSASSLALLDAITRFCYSPESATCFCFWFWLANVGF